MKFILHIIRFLVGVLFIFSGLIKANDPLGLSYKMQEFFEVWGIDWLNAFALFLSISIITFEIIAGVALLIGWQFKRFSWMLFGLIVFFTFLTGYAVVSGKVRECGCFGDCIKLTAEQSFLKDLILLVLIGILLYNRSKVSSILNPKWAITLLVATTILTIWIQVYVLNHLPLFDCLPFKVGVTIQDKMKIPADAIPDSTVITFEYKKDGKVLEFDAEHFPGDFNDSTYVFIKRYDKLIREGNAKPAIKDFVIITESGTDTTQDVLNSTGKIYILFTKSMDEHELDLELIQTISNIQKMANTQHNNFLVVSSDADNLKKMLSKKGLTLPVSKGDLVSIKTAARSNPTLYLLEQGKILSKWGRANLQQSLH